MFNYFVLFLVCDLMTARNFICNNEILTIAFRFKFLLNKTKTVEILMKILIFPVILKALKGRPHFGNAQTRGDN